jgi:hypothetical protein
MDIPYHAAIGNDELMHVFFNLRAVCKRPMRHALTESAGLLPGCSAPRPPPSRHGSLSISRLTASSMIASAASFELLAPHSEQMASGTATRQKTLPLVVHWWNAISCIFWTTIPRLQTSQTPASFVLDISPKPTL